MPLESSERKPNTFERQFSTPKHLHVSGAQIDVREMRPEKPVSDTPIVLAEAFAHGKNAYIHSLKEFFNRGRITTVYDQPRTGGSLELSSEEAAAIKEYLDKSPEEVRAALIFLETAKTLNYKRVDVLAHSRGFAYAAIAALIDDARAEAEARVSSVPKRPNVIRNIVAYGPVGIIGKDSFLSIAGRTLMQNFTHPEWPKISKEIKQEINTPEMQELRKQSEAAGRFEYGEPTDEGKAIAKNVGKELLKSQLSYVGGSLSRLASEISGLTTIELHEMIPKLSEIGIGISILRGDTDTVFPDTRSHEVMRELVENGVRNVTITGEHSSLVFDPRVAKVAENEFALLEQDRQNKF